MYPLKPYTQDELNKLLLEACDQGDLDSVRFLTTDPELKKLCGTLASVEGTDNYACFLKAVRKDHLDIVKFLYDSPDIPQALTTYSYLSDIVQTALREACTHGHLRIVEFLYSVTCSFPGGVIIKAKYGLEAACKNDQLDVVQFLLSLKSDPQNKSWEFSRDFMGSPLIYSASGGSIKIAQFLLSHKSFTTLNKPEKKELLSRAFVIAVSASQIDFVRWMLTDPFFVKMSLPAVLFKVVLDGISSFVHSKDTRFFEPQLEIVNYLLLDPSLDSFRPKRKPPINIYTHELNPFVQACTIGNLSLVTFYSTDQRLVDAGYPLADIHAKKDKGFRRGCQLLRIDVARFLLSSPLLIQAGHTLVNIDVLEDTDFEEICSNAYYFNNYAMLDFLIFEQGYTPKGNLKRFLMNYPTIQAMFEAREQRQSMTDSLKDQPVVKSDDPIKRPKGRL